MVYSGMGPDYRILVDRARKVSHTNYKRVYNEYPPTRILVQDVAKVMQEATQSAGVRPYGVSLLIAGWDDGIEPEQEGEEKIDETTGEKKKLPRKTGGILRGGPSLYQVDPSGSYFPWKATAIGKGATSAKTFLEKRHSEELELEDAIVIALLTLKETIEGEMTGENIEIGMYYLRPLRSYCPIGDRRGIILTIDRSDRRASQRQTWLRGCGGCTRAALPQTERARDRRLPSTVIVRVPRRTTNEHCTIERKQVSARCYKFVSNDSRARSQPRRQLRFRDL